MTIEHISSLYVMTLYTNTIKGLVTNYGEGGGDYKTVGGGT